MGDHDGLLKRSFSKPEHAAGELRSILPPAVLERIDLSNLSRVEGSFVDPELAERHTDLLFKAPVDGVPTYIYFLLEHQSTSDPLMAWRLSSYLHRIWADILRKEPDRKTLPPILPIVVHHGERPWSAPRSFHEIIEGIDQFPELRPFIPSFNLLIDDLVTQSDEDLQARPLPPLPMVTVWLLRDGRSVDSFLDHLDQWAPQLQRLVLSDPEGEDTLTVLRYILRTGGTLPYEFLRERVTQVVPAVEEAMASAAQQLIDEGIEKGIEKGIAALRGALRSLLDGRFGGVDEAADSRINNASVADLERWIPLVLSASTVDDVLGS